ncbi:glycogenin glucosyltransferase [Umbelopsis nana]
MTRAFVTLVANEAVAPGALVLAHRLRNLHDFLNPSPRLACVVSSDVTPDTRHALASTFDEVIQVDVLRSKAAMNLHLLGKPDLGLSLTKIALWQLIQYEKVVYLDPDVLPLRSIDELFDLEELSAAPDIGWPDWFNTSVFVATPNMDTYAELKQITEEDRVLDAGDQGLLNEYFHDWATSGPTYRIPFTYNILPSAIYSYAPALREFGNDIAIVRFPENERPWQWMRFQDGRVFPRGSASPTSVEMVQLWWDTWDKHQLQNTSIASILPQSDPLQAPELSDVNSLQNAWDTPSIIKVADNKDERTTVNPLPPLPAITVADPSWYVPEEHVPEYHPPTYAEQIHTQEQSHSHDPHHGHEHTQEAVHDHDIEQVSEHHGATDEPSQEQENHVGQTSVEEHQHEEAPAVAQEREYPMLNWNPAWEEPPTTNSTVDIPDLQIYSNVWDNPQPDTQVWIAPAITDLPPPPPMVDYHHQYIHHEVVHSEEPNVEAVPITIFPWEEQKESRPAPSRIWQDEIEMERRAREEEARVREEEEARAREEDERRRVEAEQAAAEQLRASSHYHGHQEWEHRQVVNNQQQVIQQALDTEAEIIEQTISESEPFKQEQPLDQPFVNVWDQMPSIQNYLKMIGAQDAFRKSEYQPFLKQEEAEENDEEVIYSQKEQEVTADEEEEEKEEENEEEYKEAEEDEKYEEAVEEEEYEEAVEEEEYEESEEEVEFEVEEEDDVQESVIVAAPRSTSPPPPHSNSWWGEPFAIDSMPTTPRLGKLGWRSPLMPTTPRLEDDDWDDRDLIPLPLKRTSRLFPPETLYQEESSSLPQPVAEVPKSNVSVTEGETDSKQSKKKRRTKKSRKLFADEDDMLKRTPFASAATTPTSEKSFVLPIESDESKDVVAEPKAPDSFGEYKIEWASDLLKGTSTGVVTPLVRTPSKEVVARSYFDGAVSPAAPTTPKRNKYNALASRTAWDPLHALKSLKASGEKLLISTKLQGNQGHAEDSDEEYAPAVYYDNDDEEVLGVLGLTFPTSRPTRGIAMSKAEDSPPQDSLSASPATPTAKGMSMNLTDKILQEASERRINTDIALHEAAASLVKSTEADAQDDKYAMSPVAEEYPQKDISATELEMSQGNLFKRRVQLESDAETKKEEATVEPGDKDETSIEPASVAQDADTHPLQYDIVQAATEKLRQIAGVDWEAAAKEEASYDENTSGWVFAQTHESVPSAKSVDMPTQHSPPTESQVDDTTIPTESAPPSDLIREQPTKNEALVIGSFEEDTHIDNRTDSHKIIDSQVDPKHVSDQGTATASDIEPPIAAKDQVNSNEATQTSLTDVVGAPRPELETKDSHGFTDVAQPDSTIASEKGKLRTGIPRPLTLKSEDRRDDPKTVQAYDDLKTPTQESFSGISHGHDDDSGAVSPGASSAGDSPLPKDVEKSLVDTVQSLVRKIEAHDSGVHHATDEAAVPQLMERETSQSNVDAQALSDEQIQFQLQEPNMQPSQPEVHTNVSDPASMSRGLTAQTTEDSDRDDNMSDTQYLSASEGDHQSESGTSVDWFSVQSYNGSTDHSDNEGDHRVPHTGNIHQEFLRRFGDLSELNQLSPMGSLTHHSDTEEEDMIGEQGALSEKKSTTPEISTPRRNPP